MNKYGFLEGYTNKIKEYFRDRKMNRDISSTRNRLLKALKRIQKMDFDVPVEGGLGRVFVKGELKPEVLKKLGYFKSSIAIPEKGQSQWMTWRQKDDNRHLHKHDKGWFMHQDKYPSLSKIPIVLKQKKPISDLFGEVVKAAVEGTKHVVTEAVPQVSTVAEEIAGNAPTYSEAKDMGKDDYRLIKLLEQAVD